MGGEKQTSTKEKDIEKCKEESETRVAPRLGGLKARFEGVLREGDQPVAHLTEETRVRRRGIAFKK